MSDQHGGERLPISSSGRIILRQGVAVVVALTIPESAKVVEDMNPRGSAILKQVTRLVQNLSVTTDGSYSRTASLRLPRQTQTLTFTVPGALATLLPSVSIEASKLSDIVHAPGSMAKPLQTEYLSPGAESTQLTPGVLNAVP